MGMTIYSTLEGTEICARDTTNITGRKHKAQKIDVFHYVVVEDTYDARQTEACKRLRNMLQSIAIMAVQAQDVLGSDKCSDLLYDIRADLDRAEQIQSDLNTDSIGDDYTPKG
jgi:hypothetical protein